MSEEEEVPQIVEEIASDVEKGWLPLVCITGQVRIVNDLPEVNVCDMHFLWAVSPRLAQQIGVVLIREMQRFMAETRYERRN